MFGRNVFILEIVRLLLGPGHDLFQIVGRVNIPRSFDLRLFFQHILQIGRHFFRIGSDFEQDGRHHIVLLSQKGQKKVGRPDFPVPQSLGQGLRLLKSLLRHQREAIPLHVYSFDPPVFSPVSEGGRLLPPRHGFRLIVSVFE